MSHAFAANVPPRTSEILSDATAILFVNRAVVFFRKFFFAQDLAVHQPHSGKVGRHERIQRKLALDRQSLQLDQGFLVTLRDAAAASNSPKKSASTARGFRHGGDHPLRLSPTQRLRRLPEPPPQ